MGRNLKKWEGKRREGSKDEDMEGGKMDDGELIRRGRR